MPWHSKGLLIPFHPTPKTNKTFSGEDARTQSALETLNLLHIVVLDMDLLFQLPPTLTISTQHAVKYWI